MDKRITLVVAQHEVGGQLQDWWMLELHVDGKFAMGFGFKTKEDATNALSVAEYFAEHKYKNLNAYKGI